MGTRKVGGVKPLLHPFIFLEDVNVDFAPIRVDEIRICNSSVSMFSNLAKLTFEVNEYLYHWSFYIC